MLASFFVLPLRNDTDFEGREIRKIYVERAEGRATCLGIVRDNKFLHDIVWGKSMRKPHF
jgi:hypothetical protein